MTDNFALLDEPRRPWIDPESLKLKYLALSTEAHPDRFHNASGDKRTAGAQRYAEINSAYRCLLDPKERLAHLLELELGHRPKDVQQIPSRLADLFTEVAQHCRQADGFLAGRKSVTSPLLQVQAFEQAQALSETLGALRARLQGQREAIFEELQGLNEPWTAGADQVARGPLLQRLEELFRLLRYFDRWDGQIGERIVQLSF